MGSFICFGEVLWDVFPTQKKIGGAPLNVATRLASFKNNVSLISAIGDDNLGKGILDYCNQHHINSEFIQQLTDFNTGEVSVTLNSKGSATYEILYPKAWDKISFKEEYMHSVQNADVFVFGSLVTRDKTSKKTLEKLLTYANYKVFDVNLRPPFYSFDDLLVFMKKADFIKFNDEELYLISEALGSKFKNLEQNIFFISEITDTKHICVTKGEHGAVLLYDNNLFYNSGYQTKVEDTVGSGDSFLATLLHYLQEKNPQKAINFACAVGALVAQNSGANPKISILEILSFMKV